MVELLLMMILASLIVLGSVEDLWGTRFVTVVYDFLY